MIQEEFGKRIKELRTNLAMSQIELSKKTGIERAQISKIELGKVNITLETIEKISLAFNISISELFDMSKKEFILKPFVKWAGGKTQVLEKIKEHLPSDYNRYFEPFIGGGALFFALAPHEAFINDLNQELMCVYNCLNDEKLFKELISQLLVHEEKHSEDYYRQIRELDRSENFLTLPITSRAARMIYLNKSCFNGLYRVNSKGYFNVPSAKKEKVTTFDESNMNELFKYFSKNKVIATSVDFEEAVKEAKCGDFVYFDPPFDSWDDKKSFTAYASEAFGKEEQVRLARVFKDLSSKGVKVMLSNHNTKFINDLYAGFNIYVVEAKRMINSKADGRDAVEEVIITNY